jgi:hypothetical protein
VEGFGVVKDRTTGAVTVISPTGKKYARGLRQEQYDAEVMLKAATQTKIQYFQIARGGLNAAGAIKTEVDTSITIGGMIPNNQLFSLKSFNLKPANDAVAADVTLILDTGFIQFNLGINRVLLELVNNKIPSGTAQKNSAAAAVATNTNGWESTHEEKLFTRDSGAPLFIEGGEQFGIVMGFPAGAIAPSANTKVWFFMNGITYVAI